MNFLYPSRATCLAAAEIATRLGPMVAIADEQQLYLLEFIDRAKLDQQLKKWKAAYEISPGRTGPIESIERELEAYFKGELSDFQTPYRMVGSSFRERVWGALVQIPYGATCSYREVARAIGQPLATRAAASSIGANQLAIIVPCHRVICTNSHLGGYAGGLARKEWLLAHEATSH